MSRVQTSFPVAVLNAWITPRGSLAEPQSLPPVTTRPFPTAIDLLMAMSEKFVLRFHSRCPVATSYFTR